MNFTFYNRPDYFKQLTRDIQAAQPGQRVAVASIVVDPTDRLVEGIVTALADAAGRGVEVLVLVDAYTFLHSPNKLPGPLWYKRDLDGTLPPLHSQIFQVLMHIEQCGGQVVITNTPRHRFSIMQAGRSHIKAGIVGNRMYLGGCNLNNSDLTDIMLGSNDDKLANQVYELLSAIAATGSTETAFHGKDLRFEIDATTSLLLDAGKRHQSLILDEACQLIDSAKQSLFITCQFFPGGRTAQHLLAAHKRRVDVHVSYSHPSVHGLESPAHHLQQLLARARLPDALTKHRIPKGSPKLHAKVLVSETEAIVGSHNFVSQGVTLGTAEIALHVKDPAFAKQLRQFIESAITKNI